MTVVLVHGNPETAAIWDRLADALGALGRIGVVRPSPPGFGAPVPPGWQATPQAHRDWLAGALEALPASVDGPIDLVGHDWGGAHVVNVVTTRPDLIRSWCADTVGWFEPDYTWHALARTWQTLELTRFGGRVGSWAIRPRCGRSGDTTSLPPAPLRAAQRRTRVRFRPQAASPARPALQAAS